MPRVTRFPSIRYRPGTDLGPVTAPPYDVIAPAERDRLEAAHPHNLVRITLGAQRPDDDERSNRYVRGAALLREWLDDGVLVHDSSERLWLYRADFTAGGQPRATAGLIGALELSELGGGEVYGHERTRPGPKADRLALMRTTRANLEPLWFFASRTIPGLAELVADREAVEPAGDVTDEQEVRHRVWPVPEDRTEELEAALSASPLVVADGHHRYETSLTYRDERRAADGTGPWDLTLALISDPEQLAPELRPIHRLVHGLDPERVPDRIPFPGTFAALAAAVEGAGPGTVGMAHGDRCWTLTAAGDVDTVWLAEQIIEPSGCDVSYQHDLDLVQEALRSGDTAFLMAAMPVPLVAAKALDGVRLPPKTTLFWPKPRSGLVMRDLDPS